MSPNVRSWGKADHGKMWRELTERRIRKKISLMLNLLAYVSLFLRDL